MRHAGSADPLRRQRDELLRALPDRRQAARGPRAFTPAQAGLAALNRRAHLELIFWPCRQDFRIEILATPGLLVAATANGFNAADPVFSSRALATLYREVRVLGGAPEDTAPQRTPSPTTKDRKSTRLNSRNTASSYAAVCL